MKNETQILTNNKNSVEINNQNTDKKPYIAPKLNHYGSLAALVEVNPGRARDGGVADCTLS